LRKASKEPLIGIRRTKTGGKELFRKNILILIVSYLTKKLNENFIKYLHESNARDTNQKQYEEQFRLLNEQEKEDHYGSAKRFGSQQTKAGS
jgi:hypothetical protein